MGSFSSDEEKKKKKIRRVIELLFLVIILGYLVLWIMMPTSSYRQIWRPAMRAKTSSSFVGKQGTNLLFYTFPILFIAALGCVYLHLGKKLEDTHTKSDEVKKNSISSWKRPALVKGPLGIVSWIELTFIAMFMALLIWSFSMYLYRDYMRIDKMHSDHKEKEERWEYKVYSLGLTLGLIGNICLSFLFFPVTRGSSVLPLLGLTSESSIKYHIWLGHMVMALFTGHGLCYIVPGATKNDLKWMLSWRKTGISDLAGEISLLFGLVLWATSFPPVRRKMFELFFYTHYLYSLFIIFYVLHIRISYYCIMLPGFYLFLIDRYIRFLQSRQRIWLVSSRILPCETVELNFSKDPRLNYTTTSILFVNIPSISKLQWHPFTMSSSSSLEPETLSVIIKREGSWTRKLYEILSSSSIDHIDVSVEGPYGLTSTDFLRHNTLVMVSGGSGITPFFSIIREIIFRSTTMNTKTPRILLVSSFKYSSDLTMLDLLLPISGTPSDISSLELQIEAYVTREKQPTMNNKYNVPTIWFKPKVSDRPITAILGPNSILSLAAIICSSFVIFLILLCIITHFYIYPIDHNSNEIYSDASKSLINMSIVCLSIAVAASAVVLRNKKRNTMDVKQIQDSPKGSYNADRELESLPTQSLVQATNVHFGSRPDLKKILHGCEGSSIGVLVCGPSMMRHEVATICSSGLKDNLHFESISFSW